MTRVAFATLGCKVNQYDTEALRRLFLQEGYTVVPFAGQADIYVVNTCAVTARAAQKSRQLLRGARRRNPQALVVCTGCCAQALPDEMVRTGAVDLVAGPPRKGLVSRVRERLAMRRDRSDDPLVRVTDLWRGEPPGWEETPIRGVTGRARGIIKIQEGCDEFCSYCLVPRARGPLRSRPLADILREIATMVDEGVHEIVLVGVHLGAYGRGTAHPDLDRVVREAARVPGLLRLRLSSLEPMDLTVSLLETMAQLPVVAHHLHLPLQSGSDTVLKRMGRRYSTAEFEGWVRRARRLMPDLGLTTDLMVGFPGETEEEHAESLGFVARLGFSRLHVFPFSPRPGTPAARLPGRVPARERARRRDEALALAGRLALRFHRGLHGGVLEVLVERAEEERCSPWERVEGRPLAVGWSGNYVRTWVSDCPASPNRLVRVRVERENEDGCLGRVLKEGNNHAPGE